MRLVIRPPQCSGSDMGKQRLARGRKVGRPKKLSEDDIAVGHALLAAGTISVADIAKRLGVNRDTFYTYFPRARANSQLGKGTGSI